MSDPHPRWRAWQAEHDAATARWRALEAAGASDEERQAAWTRMQLTLPRRRLSRVGWRLPLVRCHACRDRRSDVWPWLVEHAFDARAALEALIARGHDMGAQPFRRWRVELLRIAHGAPVARPEELDALERP